jgi:hypothetical protein
VRSTVPQAAFAQNVRDDHTTLPNFLVIGAEKCGTTALYHFLKQHPQIYMSPIKEPHFFCFEGHRPGIEEENPNNVPRRLPGPRHEPTDHITDIDAYRSLFQQVSGKTAVGEVSPAYIYFPKAVKRIQHYIPNAKLVAILRDPVDRAYSNFLHCVALGREPLTDFAQALEEEEIRVRNNWPSMWHYKRKGLYYHQLKRYFDAFEQDQIKVYLYEDLKADPSGLLRDIFLFLEVNPSFVADTSGQHNISGVPRNRALHAVYLYLNRPLVKRFVPTSLLEKWREPVRRWLLTRPPELSGDERKRLVEEIFREDILRLQELIDRDLSRWLEQ